MFLRGDSFRTEVVVVLVRVPHHPLHGGIVVLHLALGAALSGSRSVLFDRSALRDRTVYHVPSGMAFERLQRPDRLATEKRLLFRGSQGRWEHRREATVGHRSHLRTLFSPSLSLAMSKIWYLFESSPVQRQLRSFDWKFFYVFFFFGLRASVCVRRACAPWG